MPGAGRNSRSPWIRPCGRSQPPVARISCRDSRSWFPTWCCTAVPTTNAMVQTLGYILLSSAGAPRVWVAEDGILRDTYDDYRRYAVRATSTGYPELFLFFEMLFRHAEGIGEEELVGLIMDLEALNDADRNNFAKLMYAIGSEGIHERGGRGFRKGRRESGAVPVRLRRPRRGAFHSCGSAGRRVSVT